MPFPKGVQRGIVDNPLIETPFLQIWNETNDSPPPGSSFRITNNDEIRITNDGENRITNT